MESPLPGWSTQATAVEADALADALANALTKSERSGGRAACGAEGERRPFSWTCCATLGTFTFGTFAA